MYEIPLTFVFGVFGVGESIFCTGVLGVDVLSLAEQAKLCASPAKKRHAL